MALNNGFYEWKKGLESARSHIGREKLKNRILGILLLLIMIFSLMGCAKLIDTRYENVEVTVVDQYHRSMYLQPMMVGKTMTLITHPAIYRIIVEYNGFEYSINGEDTYAKYKNRIGQTTIGNLETKIYDDGTVKYSIVSLE